MSWAGCFEVPRARNGHDAFREFGLDELDALRCHEAHNGHDAFREFGSDALDGFKG